MDKAEKDLLKNGTVAGPVTPEMVRLCKEKLRAANRRLKRPEEEGMRTWPDFLATVRAELKGKDNA